MKLIPKHSLGPILFSPQSSVGITSRLQPPISGAAYAYIVLGIERNPFPPAILSTVASSPANERCVHLANPKSLCILISRFDRLSDPLDPMRLHITGNLNISLLCKHIMIGCVPVNLSSYPIMVMELGHKSWDSRARVAWAKTA